MPLGNPKGGAGYAAEFQSSALPWVTSSVAPSVGSPLRLDFPKVTRFFTVANTGANTLSFGFTWAGVANSSNKFILSGSQSATFELRVKSLWLQSESGTTTFSLMAGLTTVDARDWPELTGSSPSGVFGDGSVNPGANWAGIG